MRVKKFRANSMPEALALIRAELGPEAVILHTERVRAGGLFGRLRPAGLEVIAAVDADLRDFPRPTPAAETSIQQMQRELEAVKSTLAHVASTGARSGIGAAPLPPAGLDAWYQRLLAQGVAGPLARQLVQAAADELSRWAVDNEEILTEHVRRHLGRQLPASKPVSLTPGQPLVLFIIGPTGVGKTTTIAKLASTLPGGLGRSYAGRVLLITADTFRVAAIAQVTAFGEILGLPVEVAYSPEQLAAQVAANRQYDLILVDTPGRSQRSAGDVAELGEYLAAVSTKTVFLALAAGAKYEDMRQAVDAFGPLAVDGLLFTKIDETASLGAAYSLACETGLPLSYLTTGQRVAPQGEIEVATAERMVELLVDRYPDAGPELE